MKEGEPLVLGIETSCDETSAAVLRGEHDVLGHVILSQDEHRVYGGVVPELASRAHIRAITGVVDEALEEAGTTLEEIDIIGATAGPGLIGALLVGLTWAKSAAYALDKPLVPVHHMEAHLFSVNVEDPEAEPPFIALLVSGGHTMLIHALEWGRYRLLGETRDDAAGEAFDKVATVLGLDYPGGPAIECAAQDGDPRAFHFPRPMLAKSQRLGDDDYYAFSFSGLKTAVMTQVRALEAEGELDRATVDLAASFQAAAIDVLVSKTLRAVEATGCDRVIIGGGVSASRALRTALEDALGPRATLHYPSARLATDNAAMIARTALFRYARGDLGTLGTTARANLPFPGLERHG